MFIIYIFNNNINISFFNCYLCTNRVANIYEQIIMNFFFFPLQQQSFYHSNSDKFKISPHSAETPMHFLTDFENVLLAYRNIFLPKIIPILCPIISSPTPNEHKEIPFIPHHLTILYEWNPSFLILMLFLKYNYILSNYRTNLLSCPDTPPMLTALYPIFVKKVTALPALAPLKQ